MDKLVDTELHEEAVDLPEKRKRPTVKKKLSQSEPRRWKTVSHEIAELIVPWGVLIVGATSLLHSCQVSKEAHEYRQQLGRFEERRRLTDLMTTFQNVQYNEALSGRVMMDSNARNAMLAEINAIGDRIYSPTEPEDIEEHSVGHGLSTAQMLAIGNLNADSYWQSRASDWYDRAYKLAPKDQNTSSYVARTAKIYHYLRPFQINGPYKDLKALENGLVGLRSTLNSVENDQTGLLSQYYVYSWLTTALNNHGYVVSCRLNAANFQTWLIRNPTLNKLRAEDIQKNGDFTLCQNSWQDPGDSGQYTY